MFNLHDIFSHLRENKYRMNAQFFDKQPLLDLNKNEVGEAEDTEDV